MQRNTYATIITDPQQRAEAAEAERRRAFIERMEQKLRFKELAHMRGHSYAKDATQ